jgi:hypothetical protein
VTRHLITDPVPPFGASLAHGGKPHNLRDLLTTWGWEPVTLVLLALSAWLYWRGVRRLWR